MTTLTFPARGTNFAFIVSEANGYQSRDAGVIAAGAGILPGGTVLGRVTASGKFVPFNPAATDGSQNAIGILCEDVEAVAADVKRTIFFRNGEVQQSQLVFAGTPNSTQKNAAYAALALAGVLMR